MSINDNKNNVNNQIQKLVDNLKTKVKKLESYCKTTCKTTCKTNCKNDSILTYRISYPKIINKNSKKFIGLLFDNNFIDNTNESEQFNDVNDKDKISFIKLKSNNNIINYSLTLKVDNNFKDKDKDKDKDTINNICTFSLGIKELSGLGKIKIIKGSKVQYDITKDTIDGNIIVNNTILYHAFDNQELCLITTLSKKCTLQNKKSLIKILNL